MILVVGNILWRVSNSDWKNEDSFVEHVHWIGVLWKLDAAVLIYEIRSLIVNEQIGCQGKYWGESGDLQLVNYVYSTHQEAHSLGSLTDSNEKQRFCTTKVQLPVLLGERDDSQG